MESGISTDRRLTHTTPFLSPGWIEWLRVTPAGRQQDGINGHKDLTAASKTPPYRLLFTSWMHTLTEVTELPPWKTSALSNTPLFSVKKKKFLLSPQSFVDCSHPWAPEAALTQKKKSRGNSDPVLDTLNVIFLFTFFLSPLIINATRKSRSMWEQSGSEASSQRQLLAWGTASCPGVLDSRRSRSALTHRPRKAAMGSHWKGQAVKKPFIDSIFKPLQN